MSFNTGLISAILEGVIRTLPTDAVKGGLDKFLDFVENAVDKSDNKFDDAIVTPLLKALRAQLGVEETAGSQFEDKPSVDINVNVKTDKSQ